MQAINLPLISQSTTSERLTRQQQNLINAITSENDLLRVSQLEKQFPNFIIFRNLVFMHWMNWRVHQETHVKSSFRWVNLAKNHVIGPSFMKFVPKSPKLLAKCFKLAHRLLRLTWVAEIVWIMLLVWDWTYVQSTRQLFVQWLVVNLKPIWVEDFEIWAMVRQEVKMFIVWISPNTSFYNHRSWIHALKANLNILKTFNHYCFLVSSYRPKLFHADLSALPGYVYIEHCINTFWSTYLRPAPSVSSYYLKLTEYCLDSKLLTICFPFKYLFLALSVLAAYSIDEDNYGIVQEHLSSIISTFLRLELAIDLYIRSTSVSHFCSQITLFLIILEQQGWACNSRKLAFVGRGFGTLAQADLHPIPATHRCIAVGRFGTQALKTSYFWALRVINLNIRLLILSCYLGCYSYAVIYV